MKSLEITPRLHKKQHSSRQFLDQMLAEHGQLAEVSDGQ